MLVYKGFKNTELSEVVGSFTFFFKFPNEISELLHEQCNYSFL